MNPIEKTLRTALPELDTPVACPGQAFVITDSISVAASDDVSVDAHPRAWDQCRSTASISVIIQHLNDTHRWSREAIADWLDTLDADLTFPTEPVARAVDEPYSLQLDYLTEWAVHASILKSVKSAFIEMKDAASAASASIDVIYYDMKESMEIDTNTWKVKWDYDYPDITDDSSGKVTPSWHAHQAVQYQYLVNDAQLTEQMHYIKSNLIKDFSLLPEDVLPAPQPTLNPKPVQPLPQSNTKPWQEKPVNQQKRKK